MKRPCLEVKEIKNLASGLVKAWPTDICNSEQVQFVFCPIPLPAEVMKVLDFSH